MLDLNFVRNNLDLVQQKVEAKDTPLDRKLFTEIDRKRRERITNIENIKNKIGRTAAAIMENYQTSDGKIQIPAVLKNHFNGRDYL
jgi:seryl-tRNA synthetase